MLDTINTQIATQSEVGQIANAVAQRHVFADYIERKSANTLRTQKVALTLFADFLGSVGVDAVDLQTNPDSWINITWGLVEAFTKWQLQNGYAIASVNNRLSHIKTYAKLALRAGTLSNTEYALIRAISGYGHSEGANLDKKREQTRIAVADNGRKAEPVSISVDQAQQMMEQPETPQGCRDALLMAILLEHGLRVGEVALLKVEDFDLNDGTFTFYRPKVKMQQTHRLTPKALQTVRVWLNTDGPKEGPILLGSRKGGALLDSGMSERAITKRVKALGQAVGLDSLSAHDCRHYWATRAAKSSSVDSLMNAGGWSSPAMPLRYVEASQVANEGIVF